MVLVLHNFGLAVRACHQCGVLLNGAVGNFLRDKVFQKLVVARVDAKFQLFLCSIALDFCLCDARRAIGEYLRSKREIVT